MNVEIKKGKKREEVKQLVSVDDLLKQIVELEKRIVKLEKKK